MIEPEKSHCEHLWPVSNNAIALDQIKIAFASNSESHTNVDVGRISEKLMKMIREQEQEQGCPDFLTRSRVFGIHSSDDSSIVFDRLEPFDSVQASLTRKRKAYNACVLYSYFFMVLGSAV